jgi:two-component system sensor histidine kinase BaeS
LWRWLDSLRVKLFLGIAGVNVLVVLLAYLVHGWSVDQGLSAYRNGTDDARMAPLVERLARGYTEHGSWQWLVDDREAWHGLLSEQLGLPVGLDQGHDGGAEHGHRHEQNAGPWAEGRLMLLDENRTAKIGPQDRAGQALLIPISAQGRVVGYLGRPARRDVFESLGHAVSVQQGRQFAVVALGMLAAVLLNAALISGWFGRRLARVGAGAAAVAHGDYGVRLPAKGHDELDRLAGDFNHMAASLEAAQRARQTWIADIAHELRTPLAGLQAEIEALQDGVRQPSRERFDSLALQVQRLTRLVEDLRLLSLSDLGALDYRIEPLDLGELIDDFLRHPPVPCPGLRLELDLPTGLQVRADAVRLQQVLGNLLQNTLRYCDAPATLSVHLQREGAEVRLRWQDSPPGVPPEALPRLTERLYRVDDSRSRAGGGSGLGLAIVRAIVEGHGGRLAPSASVLGGLAWDIHLPLLDEGAHE